MASSSRFGQWRATGRPVLGWGLSYWPLLCWTLALSLKSITEELYSYGLVHGVHPSLSLSSFAIAALIGGAHHRWSKRSLSLSSALLLSGFCLALAPLALLISFANSKQAIAALMLIAVASGFSGGAALSAGLRSHGRLWLEAEGLSWLLAPLRLGGLSLLSLVALMAQSSGGPQATSVIGLLLDVLALTAPGLRSSASYRTLGIGLAGAITAVTSFSYLQARMPMAELRHYPGTLLYASGDQNTQRVVCVHHSTGFELYVDQRLHLGALDSARYFDALTAEFGTGSALVLSQGSGVIASRLLSAGATRVTSVAPSDTVWKLSEHNAWLKKHAHVPQPETWTLKISEPMPWLIADSTTYDYIVADIAPPFSFQDAKYYTVYFFKRLRERLTPTGVAVMPALAPHQTPRAHALLKASAEAAGLRPKLVPLRVPTLGDWSLVVLSRAAPALSEDETSAVKLSTLEDPEVMRAFLDEYPTLPRPRQEPALFYADSKH